MSLKESQSRHSGTKKFCKQRTCFEKRNTKHLCVRVSILSVVVGDGRHRGRARHVVSNFARCVETAFTTSLTRPKGSRRSGTRRTSRGARGPQMAPRRRSVGSEGTPTVARSRAREGVACRNAYVAVRAPSLRPCRGSFFFLKNSSSSSIALRSGMTTSVRSARGTWRTQWRCPLPNRRRWRDARCRRNGRDDGERVFASRFRDFRSFAVIEIACPRSRPAVFSMITRATMYDFRLPLLTACTCVAMAVAIGAPQATGEPLSAADKSLQFEAAFQGELRLKSSRFLTRYTSRGRLDWTAKRPGAVKCPPLSVVFSVLLASSSYCRTIFRL